VCVCVRVYACVCYPCGVSVWCQEAVGLASDASAAGMAALGDLSSAILRGSVAGEKPTVLASAEVTLALSRVDPGAVPRPVVSLGPVPHPVVSLWLLHALLHSHGRPCISPLLPPPTQAHLSLRPTPFPLPFAHAGPSPVPALLNASPPPSPPVPRTGKPLWAMLAVLEHTTHSLAPSLVLHPPPLPSSFLQTPWRRPGQPLAPVAPCPSPPPPPPPLGPRGAAVRWTFKPRIGWATPSRGPPTPPPSPHPCSLCLWPTLRGRRCLCRTRCV
jgi:hypothetical protein